VRNRSSVGIVAAVATALLAGCTHEAGTWIVLTRQVGQGPFEGSFTVPPGSSQLSLETQAEILVQLPANTNNQPRGVRITIQGPDDVLVTFEFNQTGSEAKVLTHPPAGAYIDTVQDPSTHNRWRLLASVKVPGS